MICRSSSKNKLRQWSLYSSGWTLLQSTIGSALGVVWTINNPDNLAIEAALLAISLFGIVCSCALLAAILTKNTCGYIPWLLLIALIIVLGSISFTGCVLSAEFLIGAVIGILLITDIICFWIVLMFYDSCCEKSFQRYRRRY